MSWFSDCSGCYSHIRWQLFTHWSQIQLITFFLMCHKMRLYLLRGKLWRRNAMSSLWISCFNTVCWQSHGQVVITFSLTLTVSDLSLCCWLLHFWFSGLQAAFVTFSPIQVRPERSGQVCGGWLLTRFSKLISCLSTAELQQTERPLYATTGAYCG